MKVETMIGVKSPMADGLVRLRRVMAREVVVTNVTEVTFT
jgi:hypothetical protein